MTEFDATVPVQWLPKFIGHPLWSRPDGVSETTPPDFYELVACSEIDTGRPPGRYGYYKRAWVRHNGIVSPAALPSSCTMRGIPQEECTERIIRERGEEYRWWEWNPPEAEPPKWELHPDGWNPALTAVVAPVGDDGALFTF